MTVSRIVDNNPWFNLPDDLPFVLPEDRDTVERFNRELGDTNHVHYLHIDKLLPEPFIGSKDAPILLLSNNPGIDPDSEKLRHRQDKRFRKIMRDNLQHEVTDYPFVYLNPAFDEWETWWRRKRVRRLIERFGQQTVARSILNVVLCPYPSRRFRRLSVPSQGYSFGLVRNAVIRKAVIILFRPGGRDEWVRNVPELQGYSDFYEVPNAQNPAITENCCGYAQVLLSIEAYLNGKQGNEVRR